MKRILLVSIVSIWLVLSSIDMFYFFLADKSLFYFRAWEAVSNYEGKDPSFIPFKPLYVYNSTMTGDLLLALHFKPTKNEVQHQLFSVDEYGFRNKVGLLEKPIDAVIIGSSYVAGAHEDQDELVSTLLTDRYNLPTYNAALYNLLDFYADNRFWQNSPKYIITLGNEGDMITAAYRHTITNPATRNDIRAWHSTQEWANTYNKFQFDYKHIADLTKNFSLVRFVVNKIALEIDNFHRNRLQVAESQPSKQFVYDPETKSMFFDPNNDNPLFGSPGKTQEDIDKSIAALKESQELLQKRGITLIVATMPSKTHMELPKYYNDTNLEHMALTHFQQALDDAHIANINLFQPVYAYKMLTHNYVYYPDDSHWNAHTNEIIAESLANKMNELEQVPQTITK